MAYRNRTLRKRILDEQNIYAAIYSLDSYLVEKGLLCEDDLKKWVRLQDKFDFDYIESVIQECQKRITEMLDTKKLFDVEVYFKVKKREKNGGYKYRPLHTASLVDQICMVAMLQPLMYNDENGTRKLSDLSRLIPGNFYGNLPTTNTDNLFCRWKPKYKKYSETIIERYKEYKETKKYANEVVLDLKNFFPSINPFYVFSLVRRTLSVSYTGKDQECLCKVLTKLLFFRIKAENIECWKEYYYQDATDMTGNVYMNCGIAQGLPQSYFFGNLVMVEIARCIKDIFKGDSYYYVDDSVTFTNEGGNLSECIEKLNGLLLVFGNSEGTENGCDVCLEEWDLAFQRRIQYKIEIHDENDGKSSVTNLSAAHSNLGYLSNIARQVSIAAVTIDNLSDEDDKMSCEKLRAILDVIDNELKRTLDDKVSPFYSDSDLKLLKRYKRYFLFRYRRILLEEEGDLKGAIKGYMTERVPKDASQLESFFESFDEEIFQAEYSLYMSRSFKPEHDALMNRIVEFDKMVMEDAGISPDGAPYLYLAKSVRASSVLYLIWDERPYYKSLKNVFKRLEVKKSDLMKKYDRIKTITSNPDLRRTEPFEMIMGGHSMVKFIFSSSEKFKRMVLNAYISTLLEMEVGDKPSVSKLNPLRNVSYGELRLIMPLRNIHFTAHEYFPLLNTVITENSVLRDVKIDNNIIEVLDLFLMKVKDIRFVDMLIQTHRFVSGLWMNGSKFLNTYTLHNEDHAICLIRNSLRLIKTIDYLNLKDYDYLILFLACYLHDISMVVHPDIDRFAAPSVETDKLLTKHMVSVRKIFKEGDNLTSNLKHEMADVFKSVFAYLESKVRAEHTQRSAEFIKKHGGDYLNYIETSLLQLVASISESHGYDVSEVYGRKSKAKADSYSEKYLMILLRLADLMDMSKDRVNYYLLRQNIRNVSVRILCPTVFC